MATQRDDKKKRRRPEANPKKKRIVHTFKESDVVDYKDVSLLRKFMSDRGKIRSRRITGLSPRRQKEVSMAIKNAREMALLPYTSTRT
ncbi:MAG: 30S ribosomal protein S18 [Actinomycetota bacterium]|nr:30S ribosomal protein S18 [Actinomycetota bacterium]